MTLSLAPSRALADKFCVTPYLQHPDTNAMTIIFFTDTACNATVKAWPGGGSEAGALTLYTTGVWVQALTNNVFHLNKNDAVEKNWYNTRSTSTMCAWRD